MNFRYYLNYNGKNPIKLIKKFYWINKSNYITSNDMGNYGFIVGKKIIPNESFSFLKWFIFNIFFEEEEL